MDRPDGRRSFVVRDQERNRGVVLLFIYFACSCDRGSFFGHLVILPTHQACGDHYSELQRWLPLDFGWAFLFCSPMSDTPDDGQLHTLGLLERLRFETKDAKHLLSRFPPLP
jgi:hypothetical protein